MRVFSSLFLLLLVACSASLDFDDAGEEYVWVVQQFGNGDRGNFTGAEPPDTAEILRQAGVVVWEVAIVPVPKCQGPGCPTYSAQHFALITARHRARAAEAGFTESRGPTH